MAIERWTMSSITLSVHSQEDCNPANNATLKTVNILAFHQEINGEDNLTLDLTNILKLKTHEENQVKNLTFAGHENMINIVCKFMPGREFVIS